MFNNEFIWFLTAMLKKKTQSQQLTLQFSQRKLCVRCDL